MSRQHQEKAFMRFLKYKTGRGPTNVKRTWMTQRLSNGLVMETLGRKIKPTARAQEGRALSCTLGKVLTCKVIVITVLGGKSLVLSLHPVSP